MATAAISPEIMALLTALKQATIALIDAREGETEWLASDLSATEEAIRIWEPAFDAEAYWQENEDSKEG